VKGLILFELAEVPEKTYPSLMLHQPVEQIVKGFPGLLETGELCPGLLLYRDPPG
jgi:hypothetical protein